METYVLNKRSLVLEGVTLGEVVELVVQVLVDLAASTVLHEQTTEDPLAAHPKNLPVFPCVSRQSNRHLSILVHILLGGGERTRAYGHRRYPCAYRSHGGDRHGERG